MFVRLATPEDAQALCRLNDDFNGVGATSAQIAESLINDSEIVAVTVEGGVPVAFICAQIFRSFCYSTPEAEITELYVDPKYRQKGAAHSLIDFIEQLLLQKGVRKIKLLTNQKNDPAIQVYKSCGYHLKNEIVFMKNLIKKTTEK